MFESNCITEICSCILLSCSYVGSLYIWNDSEARDHPSTIKKRSISVMLMTLASPLMVGYFVNNEVSIWTVMGVRTAGFLQALILPYLLTAILFLGPTLQNNYHIPFKATWSLYFHPGFWWNNFNNSIWCRNQIVAPFTEEFTFRACMLPILLQCMSTSQAVLTVPLFFGIAHLHHAIDRIRNGMPTATVLIVTMFQFTYTTVFGLYCAFLFVRTGHFISLYVVHAFCNHMGLPEFQQLYLSNAPEKNKIMLAYVVGLFVWYILLYPLTEPSLYLNNLYKI